MDLFKQHTLASDDISFGAKLYRGLDYSLVLFVCSASLLPLRTLLAVDIPCVAKYPPPWTSYDVC